ncbi:hypothetical protein ACIQXI_09145 [Lysinibacillus sp. NPDC097195]|uniref:hypothetical protein n=1 Tax=Lysinibacillus sp. NPDC097195 TaxID=3364141 RepID=UPI0038228F0B
MNGGLTLDGIKGLLYITNDNVGEYFEDYMCSLMYEESDEVVYAALELRAEWVSDSNSSISLSMEKYLAEWLNLNYKHYSNLPIPKTILTVNQKRAVEAIYKVTQKLLSSKKIQDVYLYRGFSWSHRPSWVKKGLQEGDTITIDEQRTLSSWSFSRGIAEGFVRDNNFGFVVKALMPIERIFAIIDITMESESVCISHEEAEEFEVILIIGGDEDE